MTLRFAIRKCYFCGKDMSLPAVCFNVDGRDGFSFYAHFDCYVEKHKHEKPAAEE